MNKYEIIYADPPWSYNEKTDCGGKIGEYNSHVSDNYNIMSFNDIYNLPIKDISDDNCLLFLWVTSPNLKEGIKTGESWGFKYKTVAFVWHKVLLLPGNYTMPSVELCLIFKKGKIPTPRGLRNVRQFLEEKRTRHSKKPDEIRNRIKQMFPHQNKIELFAREKYDGWDAWGNEVKSDINLF
jgi:N6-adenosine-specific RNA methylase IME4